MERILSPDDGLAAHEANRRPAGSSGGRIGWRGHTHPELDAETDANVAAALDAAVATARAKEQDRDLTFDQLQAGVLVDLITRPLDAAAPVGEQKVPEVIVLIDLDTLLHGLHDQTVGETADGHPLPVASLRRMCCDAVVKPRCACRRGRGAVEARSDRFNRTALQVFSDVFELTAVALSVDSLTAP